MMQDLEALAVAIYFAQGGVIHRYPFGVSGLTAKRAHVSSCYRQWSFNRWARRYGCPMVPLDALDHLERGQISIAGAYTPAVWHTVSMLGPQLATLHAISTSLELNDTQVRRSLEMLECKGLVRRRTIRGAHGESFFITVGDKLPSWRLFVTATAESIAA